MYVHTYVCMYVQIHTYVHTYVRMYIRMYIRTYIRTYVHTYVHTYVRTYVRTYICIAWVSGNVISRSADVYKSLVCPLIEYCVQVWPIAKVGNWQIILELKNIQRMLTRLIDDMGLLPYTERLSKLKLTILAERRSRADLIEAYKIVGGSVSYGSQLLRISRSGTNRISKAGPDNKSNIYLLSESNKVLECLAVVRREVYNCGYF